MIEHLNFFWISLLLLAGFFAGFINTLAGSGSTVTLSLLMFLGMPATVANGTNRIMILLSSIVGVASFRQQGVIKLRENYKITIPSIVGALAGAMVAVNINSQLLTKIIGLLMVFLFFMVIYKPEKWVKLQQSDHGKKLNVWQNIIMFAIGFYGGFIQLGVGVFLLAGLVLGVGYDLMKANVLKIFIVLVYTLCILPVFFLKDQVNIYIGLILAVGSMFGAYVSAKFAVSWGPKFVRIVLLIMIFVSAVKFLGIYDWVKALIIA